MLKRVLERRTPYFWMIDDNIAAFVRLEEDVHGCLQRHWDGAVFREAFMHVQMHPGISDIGLAGFLRATGTEVNKKATEVLDALTIYKVFLVNTVACAGVEYIKALSNFEDIAFTRDLLLRGIRTLKVQTFAYWSFHTKNGGCAEQRGSTRDDMDLIHPSFAVTDLDEAEQAVVTKLQEWVRRHKNKPVPRKLEVDRAAAPKRRRGGHHSGCQQGSSVLSMTEESRAECYGIPRAEVRASKDKDGGRMNTADVAGKLLSQCKEKDGVDSVFCVQCHRDEEEGNDILLCDGLACNSAFHQFCLPWPLERVPRGEWFCLLRPVLRALPQGLVW